MGTGRWQWVLGRLLLTLLSAGLLGLIVWAGARFGLDRADQTSSVAGGVIGLISLLVSLYALRTPAGSEAPTGGSGTGRDWISAAARHSSYQPPRPQTPVRGRDQELAALRRLVRGGGDGLAVVCGAGGLGKTTLAAETARQAEQAGQAVFWVRWQDDRARLADDLTRIAQILGLADTRLNEAQQGRTVLVDVVWEHLTSTTGWVIVVDNVDTPACVGTHSDPVAVYRGWLRPGGSGLLLVTSRDTSPATWGPQAEIVHLQPLDDVAAGSVLRDAAPDAGTADEARALGARLGGLPLALNAAGHYLASLTSRYTTFAAYHDALEREFGDLIGASHPQAADPAIARAVARHTWDLSLDQLHADGSTHARPLLHLLALFEAAPIPRSLITAGLLADATGQAVTAQALETALAGLYQYGLLASATANTAGGGTDSISVGHIVLHPLVREVMALALPESDRGPWLIALHAHLTRAVDETVRTERAGWPTARLLTPHLPLILSRTTSENFAVDCAPLKRLADLLNDAGAATEVRLLYQHILDAASRHLGPDHPETLLSRENLALALRDLGRYQEGADLHQRTITDRERVLGPDHPDTLTSRDNFAGALRGLGRYQEAAELHRRTFTDRERILGPDHPDTLTSRDNLAYALRGLGRYQEAAELHRRTLADRERILGPDHPGTLISRNNLAYALEGFGEYQEAADLHRRNVTDRERVLGADHPRTLNSRNNLASALRGLGHYREAADLHRRILADRERILGPDHPDTLTSRSSLAYALECLGEYQEAADLHRRTLADRERVLGPDHPGTLISRSNLANTLCGLGKYPEAADLHRRTLADRERVLGPDHPDTLTSRDNLAAAQAALTTRTRTRRAGGWRIRR
ncbi:FxSxx-COOH system tetratricopeptide repeat protein [Streptomyces sp. NPDC006332]|uniref:FxSxx-COOH system tetratricopeptide repeat protein n=1 Tax=Streptomyces sp. NPDC006332 TaxID=3155456 RepID=UPI0033AB9420